jgi:Zn-dependent peptidase ImmA (M78 family)
MSVNEYLIEKQASEFRRRLDLSDSANIDLESLLLKLNVITVFLDLSEKFSGMSLKIDEESRFLLINSAQNAGRQNFTIGHELYHLFYDTEYKPHPCLIEIFGKKHPSEYNADSFSANFLMPRAGILGMIPSNELKKDTISLNTILYLENYYKVSRLALLYRLLGLDLIGRDLLNNFNRDIIKSAVEYGYYDSIYKPGNKGKVIGNYGSLAKALYSRDKISESHYLELMKAIEFIEHQQGE